MTAQAEQQTAKVQYLSDKVIEDGVLFKNILLGKSAAEVEQGKSKKRRGEDVPQKQTRDEGKRSHKPKLVRLARVAQGACIAQQRAHTPSHLMMPRPQLRVRFSVSVLPSPGNSTRCSHSGSHACVCCAGLLAG